ncbi:calcium-binding protein [Roseomonas fluvialis]|uniref:Peptidase M10 serralysin C-terminal domain-containing protein n=1 Tax=Roseomonas fluvialis TaxID=1750527 RepID=A0ABM7XXE0_9PROT|nr:calcium-binding protein [Roseomonas fluvialis]BDG70132.1 hypothetical protein Rmf_00610 [Roseomonas fluvialis]
MFRIPIFGNDAANSLSFGSNADFAFHVMAGGGNDYVRGGDLDDLLEGGSGDDDLRGGGGHDILRGGTGDDDLLGGEGNDVLHGGDGRDMLAGDGGNDALHGGSGNDDLRSSEGNDALFGDAGNDWLRGEADHDQLWGGSGADTLIGGAGQDTLTGGSGADSFTFWRETDSQMQARDVIRDFEQGIDRIDLSLIDARDSGGGFSDFDDAFTFRGDRQFTGTAGELRYDIYVVGGGESVTILRADTNGDRTADLEVRIEGAFLLNVADFVL